MTMTTDHADPVAACAREGWRRALDKLPDIEAEAARLRDTMMTYGLLTDERLLCDVLEPRFMSERELQSLAATSVTIASAFHKVTQAIMGDPETLLPHLGELGPLEARLFAIPVRLDNADVSVRLDATATPGGWSYFEVNGSIPGGLEIMTELKEIFRDTPMFRSVAKTANVRGLDLKDGVCRSILNTWELWGGSGKPVVAIVDWLDEAPYPSEFRSVQRWMNELGCDCLLANPTDLEIRGDRLTAGSRDIDVVYRRLTVMDMVDREDETDALITAAERQIVCIVDPFVVSVLDRKAIFAFLTDDRFDFGFTADEARALRRSVPWTRRLQDDVTTLPDGSRGSLPEYCLKNKAELVIKPNHDFGGHGVHIGHSLDDNAWSDVIETALREDMVVQNYIAMASDSYLSLSDAGREVAYTVTSDPYMFSGELGGLLSRLSVTETSNVMAGGSVVPCFIVDA